MVKNTIFWIGVDMQVRMMPFSALPPTGSAVPVMKCYGRVFGIDWLFTGLFMACKSLRNHINNRPGRFYRATSPPRICQLPIRPGWPNPIPSVQVRYPDWNFGRPVCPTIGSSRFFQFIWFATLSQQSPASETHSKNLRNRTELHQQDRPHTTGCTVWSTLSPCCHHRRTAECRGFLLGWV